MPALRASPVRSIPGIRRTFKGRELARSRPGARSIPGEGRAEDEPMQQRTLRIDKFVSHEDHITASVCILMT